MQRFTGFFYKQLFYEQHQAETGKNASKSYSTPWGWTFAIWKLFAFFIYQKQPPEVFLEISQISQENTCVRASFLIKLQTSGLQLYSKTDSGTGVFLWILWNF